MTPEKVIERVTEELARRGELPNDKRQEVVAAALGMSGRTMQAIAKTRGLSAEMVRQWMMDKHFRQTVEWVPELAAEIVDELLREEAARLGLGSFGAAAASSEFFGPSAAIAIAMRLEKSQETNPRYWAVVQRLAAASLEAEQRATAARKGQSTGWLAARNDEALLHFRLAGYGHPMEECESLARQKLFERLREALSNDGLSSEERQEAKWIAEELRAADDRRSNRLAWLRGQLFRGKSLARDRVKRFRQKGKGDSANQ